MPILGLGSAINAASKDYEGFQDNKQRRQQVSHQMELADEKMNLAHEQFDYSKVRGNHAMGIADKRLAMSRAAAGRAQSNQKMRMDMLAKQNKAQQDYLKRLEDQMATSATYDGINGYVESNGEVYGINRAFENPTVREVFGLKEGDYASKPNVQDINIRDQAGLIVNKIIADAGGVPDPRATQNTSGEGEGAVQTLPQKEEAINAFLSSPLAVQVGSSLVNMEDVAIKTGAMNKMASANRRKLQGEINRTYAYIAGFRKSPQITSAEVAENKALGVYGETAPKPTAYQSKVEYQAGVTGKQPGDIVNAELNPVDDPVGAPAGTGAKSVEHLQAYANEKNIDLNSPTILDDITKLPPEEKQMIETSARDIMKKSGAKLIANNDLSKALNTLTTFDGDASQMDQGLKDMAGIGDAAINTVQSYFESTEGIRMKRDFLSTFNNMLSMSSRGHISKAELDNMEKAYGSIAQSNEVVARNLQKMVKGIGNQLRAATVNAPTAGNILYGNMIGDFDKLDSTFSRILGDGVDDLGFGDAE